MDYLTAKTPPVREDRLGAGIAFGGTCRELHCARREGCLNLAGRAFSSTQGCQFTLSLAIINTLKNAVVIMHGPIGCGACSIGSEGARKTYQLLRGSNAGRLVWLNTNLDEAAAISGGEENLKEAIRYADREFRPEVIVIPVSCIPALIGDDVDAVVAELQEETAAILIPVHCSGFKTKVMATAYDDVYHGILRKLVRKPERRADKNAVPDDLYEVQRKFRDSRTVNILNVSSMSRGDELELERLLNAIGLEVRFLPCYSGEEDFQYALESSLNVSICGTHDDYFIEHLKTLYDIPFLIDTIPIGRKNTARWLLKIAEHFDLRENAQRIIDAENQALDKVLEQFRDEFTGKTVFLAGGEVRIIATAEIIQDLGMEIVGFKGHHYDQFAEPIFESLDNVDEVVFNVATQQPAEMVNLIKRLKPDLIISHTGGNNISAKLGMPLMPLFGPNCSYMGYSGVFEVSRRIRRIMQNSQFNRKLAQHRPLPYKASWYEKDPFTYIKKEG